MWTWLVKEWQWPAAALFAGLIMLAMLPPLAFFLGAPVALVFAQLPIYLVHQYEEHTGDRFRRYINRTIAGGQEALTPEATFWINSLGVWAVILMATYLAWLVAPWAGLVAGYLTLVNGLVHLPPTIIRKEYNPGLITGLLLFIPLGGWCIYESSSGGGFWPHAFGLLGAVAIHAAIVVHVLRRIAKLNVAQPSPA